MAQGVDCDPYAERDLTDFDNKQATGTVHTEPARTGSNTMS